MKYILSFIFWMISIHLPVNSNQADFRNHRVSKQSSKSHTSPDIDYKMGPYRSDFRAESRQERNSNVTDESAQQPENGPPNPFWYNPHILEFDYNSKMSNSRNVNGVHHALTENTALETEKKKNKKYQGRNSATQTDSEFKDTFSEKYKIKQSPNMQSGMNSRISETMSDTDKDIRYESSGIDSTQYSEYDGYEGYARKPLSYPYSLEHISDKKVEDQMKSNNEFHQLHPYTSFSNLSNMNEERHLQDDQRKQNSQISHQGNSPPGISTVSDYSSENMPANPSYSAHKHSKLSPEPYSAGYKDSSQYHPHFSKSNSRLPEEPYSSSHYEDSDIIENSNSNYNNQNSNSKELNPTEQSHIGGGTAQQNYHQLNQGSNYDAQGHRQQISGKSFNQQPLNEKTSGNNEDSLSDQDDDNVSKRVKSTKKDMQPASSETDTSFKEEHDGFLDMGAYTDEQGSFGWYADFPVGKEHDKVTYSFS